MKNKTIQFGLIAGMIATGMLLDIVCAQPKVSAANRETIRIMRTIKIPPPYTPVYQPYVWQQYLPSATPDYSPKVGPVQQPFSIPASNAVAPSALPVAKNTANASVTNVPIAGKAAKTPASAETKEKEKAPEVIKPVEKTPVIEKK